MSATVIVSSRSAASEPKHADTSTHLLLSSAGC
jgi:hypothetical protein